MTWHFGVVRKRGRLEGTATNAGTLPIPPCNAREAQTACPPASILTKAQFSGKGAIEMVPKAMPEGSCTASKCDQTAA
jgi:hypothetical protein